MLNQHLCDILREMTVLMAVLGIREGVSKSIQRVVLLL